MKRIFGTLLASILMAAGLASIPSTASATTLPGSPDSCSGVNMMSGAGDCWDFLQGSFSAAKASTSAEVVAVNGVDIHSAIQVVSRIQANGATKAQRHGHKIRIHKRMKLWTSYYNTSGQEVWHWKTYPRGKVFIKGSDGYYHDGVCWNKVKIKTRKPVGRKIYGKIKIVQYFVFQAKSVAEVSDYVTAKAMAWDNSDTCHAEASGSGSASFYASAYAYLSGTVRSTLLAQVKQQSSANLSAKLAGKSLVDIHGQTSASASGQAVAEAAAYAVCKSNTPPSSPPVMIDVTQVNDVDVTNTTEVCATVSLPGSDSGTLTFSARFGAFTTTNTFVVNGQVQKCATYQAPTEVPSGGTDTITYTIRDNVTGLSDSDTTTFRVNPSPQPPL
jgi:hypothetical protein